MVIPAQEIGKVLIKTASLAVSIAAAIAAAKGKGKK